MFKEIVDDAKSSMAKSIEILKSDLSKMRTGRANPAILDGVRVEYYGVPTPLNQVAAVAVADPRLITIKPWEKSLLGAIERAIIKSELGITPSNDGEMVRLPIPPLTRERRDDLAKQVRKHGEDTKISVRNIRRDANEFIKAEEGTSEDDVQRALKLVQDVTDQAVKQIDEIVAKKETELTEL